MKESLEAYHKLWALIKQCFIENESGALDKASLSLEDQKEMEKYSDFIYPKVAFMAFKKLKN